MNESLSYLHGLHSVVGNLTCEEFPQVDAEGEDVSLLGVDMASDDFGCHPLVGSTLACHHAMSSSGLEVMSE